MSRKSNVNIQMPAIKETHISYIMVSGYKSIRNAQTLDIKPLTILAGANNSGKSSLMQPLLLLKQTLEATFDPGPLLLNGPNVHFTSAEQLLAQLANGKRTSSFEVEIGLVSFFTAKISFKKKSAGGIRILRTVYHDEKQRLALHEAMSPKQIMAELDSFYKEEEKIFDHLIQSSAELVINRNRCFLDIIIGEHMTISMSSGVDSAIRQIIHLPGLRGNPERTFPVAAVGLMFPGTFQEYAASIIAQWQAEKRSSNLSLLGKYLEKLGLTWKVSAKAINDTQVELQVGRLPHSAKSGAADMVNIADVGFGVSQVLPVLVALLVAEPGQLVYIEEPEIHLHPRAQSAMAEILADAAKRGVRVVIETHSQLLLLGIQTLVAKGSLSPELVKLHWFQRGNDGSTKITSTDLDEAGAFGDWPEDFAEVALEAESRYLDAAESQQTIN